MERRITETEREILRLLGKGLAPHEIAERLGMSETTVTWIVSNIVGEWGSRRTDDLARALASAWRGRWVAQFALPLAVMGVLTLATALVLSTAGTLHGPPGSPSATPSATSFGGSGPTMSPDASVPPAADGAGAPVAPTPAPVAPTPQPIVPTQLPVVPTLPPLLPTQAPVVPTLPPVIPTIVPTAAPSLPLPPLPTVPPLPTPHLPSL